MKLSSGTPVGVRSGPYCQHTMHMREQYILPPTESSPGSGNPGPQRQRMVTWSGDTGAAGIMQVNQCGYGLAW